MGVRVKRRQNKKEWSSKLPSMVRSETAAPPMVESAMVNFSTGRECHRDPSDEAELVVAVAREVIATALNFWPAKVAAKEKKNDDKC